MTTLSINRFISEEDINGVIVFGDSETTGLSEDDLLLEIALVKLDNRKVIKELHYYIDPGENVNIPVESSRVHGITNEVMADMRNNYKRMMKGEEYTGNVAYPCEKVWNEVIEFINGEYFIAHNARFDYKFISNTHERMLANGTTSTPLSVKKIIDTVAMAKILIPRGHVTLDALCNKFGIDKSSRSGFHGAMIDTRLLIDVFWRMVEGKNSVFKSENNLLEKEEPARKKRTRSGMVVKIDDSEAESHSKFMNKIKK